MADDRPWPFDIWQKIAVTQLGISPQDFWQISLRDWFAITKTSAPGPMTRQDLIQLEDQYETRN